jgi:hypothetical protein
MTEAREFRPNRQVPFGAQLTREPPVSAGLTKRLKIEELWNDHGIDSEIAPVVDALPGLMVESAPGRLDQHAPAGYDINEELRFIPAAEMPEDLIAAEEPSLGEVSAEDRRDEIDEARDSDAFRQGVTEQDPDFLGDLADAATD